jgi:hypothetical protein
MNEEKAMTDRTTARGEDAPDSGKGGYAKPTLVRRQALAEVTAAVVSMMLCVA